MALAWRTAVDPVYPRVAGLIAGGGAALRPAIHRTRSAIAARSGAARVAMSCWDGRRRPGLQAFRPRSARIRSRGDRTGLPACRVRGRRRPAPGSRPATRIRRADPACSTTCTGPCWRARSPAAPSRGCVSPRRRAARSSARAASVKNRNASKWVQRNGIDSTTASVPSRPEPQRHAFVPHRRRCRYTIAHSCIPKQFSWASGAAVAQQIGDESRPCPARDAGSHARRSRRHAVGCGPYPVRSR